MQCTFGKTSGFPSNEGLCNDFISKDKFAAIALGGSTKFKLLYIDLRNRIESYPNSVQEGAVRPPSYKYAAYSTEPS